MSIRLIEEFNDESAALEYQQKTGVNLPSLRNCFRLSFKFTACGIVGGEFSGAATNFAKTSAKQTAYRGQSKGRENDPNFDFSNEDNFRTYMTEDIAEAKKYLAEWSKSFKDAKKQEHTVLPGEIFEGRPSAYLAKAPIDKGNGFLLGIYGRTYDKRKPIGHCISVVGGDQPILWDSRNGKYGFDAGDNIGKEIETYVAKNYWMVADLHFFIMPLSAARVIEKTPMTASTDAKLAENLQTNLGEGSEPKDKKKMMANVKAKAEKAMLAAREGVSKVLKGKSRR